MKKNLTKGVLVSAAMLVAAVLLYLMTDISGSAESLYLLNVKTDFSTYGTKNAFKTQWYYMTTDERIRKQEEYNEASENLNVPDSNISTNIGNVTVTVPEGGNEEYVYNTLAGVGYTDEAICGIMGNLMVECGGGGKIIFNSTQNHNHDSRSNEDCMNSNCGNVNVGGDAHGVAQWDKGRRVNLIQGAISQGVAWYDPAFQMNFLVDEINSNYYSKWVAPSKIFTDMPVGTDPVEWACFKWCKYFEVCAGASTADWNSRSTMTGWNERMEYANKMSGR